MCSRQGDGPFTIHTSLLFNPRKKTFDKNISIVIDPTNGAIADVYDRQQSKHVELKSHDIDLRGKVVMPGFVDAHTHVFLHPYE